MTTLLATPLSAAAPESFDDRCARLGLRLWMLDAQGATRRMPMLEPPLARALDSTLFRTALSDAARSAAAGAATLEFLPGCWGFPIVGRRGKTITGVTLAVGFDSTFPRSTAFLDICRESGADPSAAAAALRPATRDFAPLAPDLAAMLAWMHSDVAALKKISSTLDEFSGKLAQAYEEVNFLFRLARFLTHVETPSEMMQMLLAEVRVILPFRWMALRFGSGDGVSPALAGRLLTHGAAPCGPQAIDLAARELLERAEAQGWTNLLAPGEHPLATALNSELLAAPINHGGRVIGVLLAGNKAGDDPALSSTETQLAEAVGHFIGVFHENAARFTEQQELFLGTVGALTNSIDAKDRYTCGHSERVGLLAEQMARVLGLPEKEIETYRLAGMVHDVGKIGVPEAVLRKPGRLTDDEFAEIQKHPEIGFNILRAIPQMASVLPGVLHHHERWDGKGYPHKIAGETIPMIARVLALADTFDAMSSHRSYRTARPREEVLAELTRCAGAQFDPALVPHFITLDFTPFDIALLRAQGAQ